MNEDEYVQFRTSADVLNGLHIYEEEQERTNRLQYEREYAEIESPINATLTEGPRYEIAEPSPLLLQNGKRKHFFKSDL